MAVGKWLIGNLRMYWPRRHRNELWRSVTLACCWRRFISFGKPSHWSSTVFDREKSKTRCYIVHMLLNVLWNMVTSNGVRTDFTLRTGMSKPTHKSHAGTTCPLSKCSKLWYSVCNRFSASSVVASNANQPLLFECVTRSLVMPDIVSHVVTCFTASFEGLKSWITSSFVLYFP